MRPHEIIFVILSIAVIFLILYFIYAREDHICTVESATSQKIGNQLLFEIILKDEQTGRITRNNSPEIWAQAQSFKRVKITTNLNYIIQTIEGIE